MLGGKVALLFVSLMLTVYGASQDIGQQKLDKMRRLREVSKDGIIELSPSEYEMLVIQNPRPYNLINLFTVTTGCDECAAVYEEFIGAAYSYKESEDKLDVPTFFTVEYYSSKPEMKKIFAKHDFKTIPYLAMSEMQQKRDEGPFYKLEDLWRIKKDDAYGTQQLLDHINKRFNNDVPIKFPFHQVVIKNLTLFAVLVTLIRVFVAIQDYLINQALWFSIAIVGYFICTSGIVYTILNNMPMFRFEQDEYGKAVVSEYFMRNNRGQYGGEGYIASFLAICVSMGFLLMVKADAIFKTTLSRRIAIGVAIVVTMVAMQSYLYCYKLKYPWHNPNFSPPDEYLRGPIMRDQGNNI